MRIIQFNSWKLWEENVGLYSNIYILYLLYSMQCNFQIRKNHSKILGINNYENNSIHENIEKQRVIIKIISLRDHTVSWLWSLQRKLTINFKSDLWDHNRHSHMNFRRIHFIYGYKIHILKTHITLEHAEYLKNVFVDTWM